MKIHLAFVAFAALCGVAATAQENAPLNSAATAITGTGTTGYISRFTGSATIGNSRLFQNAGGNIGIGTASPAATLDVHGVINATTGFKLAGSLFAFGAAGGNNAFLGFAGNSTMTGTYNIASGRMALHSNTTGSFNTADGVYALFSNNLGNNNTACGYAALYSNTSGNDNAAVGIGSLSLNTSGIQNTAIGDLALATSTTANLNTATGYQALWKNTTGYENTAVGSGALISNTTGYFNTAIGRGALTSNTTGVLNTAVGSFAEVGSTDLVNATVIGAEATVTASNSLVLGSSALYNGMANTNVGIDVTAPSNIFTILQGGGHAIADGWDTYSSRRFKTNIRPIENALGKVEQLRGVSYDLQSNGKHEVGVIAEEVGVVIPEVVSWESGDHEAKGVDYGRLTSLLIEATKRATEVNPPTGSRDNGAAGANCGTEFACRTDPSSSQGALGDEQNVRI